MTKKKKLYKCWYKNCNEKVEEGATNYFQVGAKRYHKGCYENQEDLKKSRELYIEYLQPSVVHAQLNKVINTIIIDKKVEPSYLLFVIEYLIDNDIEINYPYSLYYKISDFKILRKYKNKHKPTSNFKIYS